MSKVVAFRGNFGPSFSTESHIALSLESLGHTVIRCQEDAVSWAEQVSIAADADLFLWTCTYGMAHVWEPADAHRGVKFLNKMLPTAMIHLDRWVGLDREDQLHTEPWANLQYLFTADGGNQDKFAALGINHFWSPPAVYHAEAIPGTPRPEYTSDIAFVGSWQGHYHRESRHRFELIRFLRRTFGNRVAFWPKRGQPAVRGQALNDLYASVKIAIGDSCMIGRAPQPAYHSDRIPETLGRGGFLLHPDTLGVMPDLYTSGIHLVTWKAFDWKMLRDQIDFLLTAGADVREEMREKGQLHVQTHHTYRTRMEQVLNVIDGVSPDVISQISQLSSV